MEHRDTLTGRRGKAHVSTRAYLLLETHHPVALLLISVICAALCTQTLISRFERESCTISIEQQQVPFQAPDTTADIAVPTGTANDKPAAAKDKKPIKPPGKGAPVAGILH